MLTVPSPEVAQSLPLWQVGISSCIPGTRPVNRSACSPAASSLPRGCGCRTWSTKLQANLSGANELQHWQLLQATGSSLRAPPALSQPASWAPGSARPGLRTHSVPERPPQPPRNSRDCSPRRPPPRSPRPARLHRLSPRSPQGGQVPPAAAGSGHTVRHQPTWQRASALAPQALQTRRRH